MSNTRFSTHGAEKLKIGESSTNKDNEVIKITVEGDESTELRIFGEEIEVEDARGDK